ncbi:hypothetical protein CCHR01_19186 [Colletotrichum chrysophilum]|uniref:Uncharacterized protein n=1 Tax=Colletotrichum chrysophilum TaxID=1836956 RepID=A0AAD8ZYQ3_9PEZI|nr:hypothetical protein CCHR01_19186 [Colletotrichum chrysophilum]
MPLQELRHRSPHYCRPPDYVSMQQSLPTIAFHLPLPSRFQDGKVRPPPSSLLHPNGRSLPHQFR